MKIQYLGDSRDSFKWDYQDHLTRFLGYPELKVVPMLTSGDGTTQGQTPASSFPARREVIGFCERLRAARNLRDIRELPKITGAGYSVVVYRPHDLFTDGSRSTYFGYIGRKDDKIVFLDPDIGFEPRNRNEKHVGYTDIEAVLNQVSYKSVISVFQYYRRIKFDDDFRDIRRKLFSGYSVAIYGHHVMFVSISRSLKTIQSVVQANLEYAQEKRLSVVAYSIEEVLDTLNTHKVRATYSAVASLIGTKAATLAPQYLGNHRPYASWVVGRATGLPTGYSANDLHPDLQINSYVIDDTAELNDLIRTG